MTHIHVSHVKHMLRERHWPPRSLGNIAKNGYYCHDAGTGFPLGSFSLIAKMPANHLMGLIHMLVELQHPYFNIKIKNQNKTDCMSGLDHHCLLTKP